MTVTRILHIFPMAGGIDLNVRYCAFTLPMLSKSFENIVENSLVREIYLTLVVLENLIKDMRHRCQRVNNIHIADYK